MFTALTSSGTCRPRRNSPWNRRPGGTRSLAASILRAISPKRGATNYAQLIRKKGYDVYVDGVEAYSTLGWFKDPVLNTFITRREPELAEVLFHELGHKRVFARGDTDFNEAYATTVGQ